MVYEDRAWDYHTFQPDRDTKKADDKLARILNATDPDMSKFQARGGKLIMYHGWSDAAITPLNAIAITRPSGSPSRSCASSWFRECSIAAAVPARTTSASQSPGVTADAEHDINAALERWVEEGVAPAQIIAKSARIARVRYVPTRRSRPTKAPAAPTTPPTSSVSKVSLAYCAGNNPGIQRDASAAGKARRNGALGLSETRTPALVRAETIRRAWRSPVPTTASTSPRANSPR